MRRLILIFLPIAIILTAVAAFLYRDPQVRGLFQSGIKPPLASVIEPAKKRSAPVEKPRKSTRATKVPVRTVQPPTPAEEVREEPAIDPAPVALENQVPNSILSLTLLRILMAKDLGDGISVSVTDQKLLIAGFAGTEEKRRQILEVAEKARENRKIDASHLIVRPTPNPDH